MPPKKPKDLSSAPVYSMPHEQQVRLLSDALLREFMHRRGYLDTLKMFDEENPRDAETISSRALMSDLMALDSHVQQSLKSEGVETIMEMLCYLCVQRRQELERLTAEVSDALPVAPSESEFELLRKKLHRYKKREKKAASKRASLTTTSKSANPKKFKETVPSVWSSEDNMVGGMTMDDLLGSSSSTHASSLAHSPLALNGQREQSHGLADILSRKGEGNRAASAATDQLGPSTLKKTTLSWNNRDTAEDNASEGSEGIQDDDSDASSEDGSLDFEGESCLIDAATVQAVCGVLYGGARTQGSSALSSLSPPASFLQQGFVFSEVHDCALIQWQRGPGAAIAVVQAFVAAYYYEKEIYQDKELRQRDCLRRTLLTILTTAQPDATKIVLVYGCVPLKRCTARHFTHSLVERFRMWKGFSSPAAVDSRLQKLLITEKRWMAPRGNGLWCFLMSLVLSRGVAMVKTDMARHDTATLIAPGTGDGTTELANLLLCGRALGYRHNGTWCGEKDGGVRRGCPDLGTLHCGFLSPDDMVSSKEASSSRSKVLMTTTDPVHSSWIVLHKDHFSNLFMTKDTRKTLKQKLALGGEVSMDFIYWDALTEDDAYTLTVKISEDMASLTLGGHSPRTTSFVNTAITSIPNLHTGIVDWNGETPVRK